MIVSVVPQKRRASKGNLGVKPSWGAFCKVAPSWLMGRLKPDSIKHLRTDSASAGNTS